MGDVAQNPGTGDARRWLVRVTLERFKAAFKPEPILLPPFTVLIGRNGSGKSTLLEALQWVDTTLRHDARTACERYQGVHDLLNLRSRVARLYFKLGLEWATSPNDPTSWMYSLRVEEDRGGQTPTVSDETLSVGDPATGRSRRFWIRKDPTAPGTRVLFPDDPQRRTLFEEPDRLCLTRGARAIKNGEPTPMDFLQDFWRRAVFLRLSPNRLTLGSSARRRSFEPLLDEEGQNLPALLADLGEARRNELVDRINTIMRDIKGVELSGNIKRADDRINYRLLERMPYRGRTGRFVFPIPSWMLSEGTRRVTAILALLLHEPPPSLLCIEEIENGLDPWTVLSVLQALQSAADSETQVIATTHSPWLLDHVPIESVLQVRRTEGETRYELFADRAEVKVYARSVPAGTRYVNEAE